jgi:hypothetical protein
MSINPNTSVHYLPDPLPTNLNENWRKYIIQAATANDIRLNFTDTQKLLIPKVDMDSYSFPSYPKPYTSYESGTYTENTDLCFGRFRSPDFNLWIEKIKVCLHTKASYGCVKINVWDFGTDDSSVPVNLVGIEDNEDVNVNIPLTLYYNNSLISNAIDDTDDYMTVTEQTPKLRPFTTDTDDNIILANSLLRFGVQYAEGDAYGLKIFLVCWVLECDKV